MTIAGAIISESPPRLQPQITCLALGKILRQISAVVFDSNFTP